MDGPEWWSDSQWSNHPKRRLGPMVVSLSLRLFQPNLLQTDFDPSDAVLIVIGKWHEILIFGAKTAASLSRLDGLMRTENWLDLPISSIMFSSESGSFRIALYSSRSLTRDSYYSGGARLCLGMISIRQWRERFRLTNSSSLWIPRYELGHLRICFRCVVFLCHSALPG